MNITEITQQVSALIESARHFGIPLYQIDEMVSLAQANEPGIALENFCAQLYEYDLAVPAPMIATIVKLGTAMGLSETHWRRLEASR